MASKKDKKARKKQEALAAKTNQSSKKKVKKQKTSKQKATKVKTSKKYLLIALAVVAFTALCFYTAIPNGFVNWDDDKNFYENENITSLNDENFWANTKEIFKDDIIGGYNPLTIWTFAIEHQLFDKFNNPHIWHLNNVILHLLCTFFVFLIGRKMGLETWACILFAGLFGVHPLRVESVAWVTERKDVLYGFFYLVAIYYYLKYILDEKKIIYLIILGICFVLSLFSKIQAVILPVSLVLIDYYFDGKLNFKKILYKTPLFIGSLIIGYINIKFLREQGSFETNTTYEGIDRLFIGSFQYTVYLIKSLVPYRMSPLYPYPASMPAIYYVSIISFILSAGVMIWAYLKDKRAIFFGLGFFIANVFFLLQILGAGQGFLADRFTYIPYIGLFFVYSFYFQKLLSAKPQMSKILQGLVLVLLLAFGFMTHTQNKIWKDSGTLWTHVLKYYKNSVLPYGNRANFYRDNGQRDLALKDYNERLRLQKDAKGYNSRARLYFNSTNIDTLKLALLDYNEAIKYQLEDIQKLTAAGNPLAAQQKSKDIGEYYVNRGATYAKLNNLDQALADLNEGIVRNPGFLNGYNNRSSIYAMRGQFAEALQDVNKLIELGQGNLNNWLKKAQFHNNLGQGNEAMNAVSILLRNNPNNGLYYIESCKANLRLKNYPKAKQDLQKARDLGATPSQKLVQAVMSL